MLMMKREGKAIGDVEKRKKSRNRREMKNSRAVRVKKTHVCTGILRVGTTK